MNLQSHADIGWALVLSMVMAVILAGLLVRYAFFKKLEGAEAEAQRFHRDFLWWCAKLVLIDLSAFILLFTGGLDRSWFGAGVAGIIVYTLMGVHIRYRAWKAFKEKDR